MSIQNTHLDAKDGMAFACSGCGYNTDIMGYYSYTEVVNIKKDMFKPENRHTVVGSCQFTYCPNCGQKIEEE